ncbi:MAG: formate dehydrogenase accessory sulfurtransferase FdhD [Candidatus Bathyarchaeota archaeon]|nr:MAG: formate dehydrogenase accessory sulfurtransferase FdhD [Candidatus Bathyarchaeota archaeon]
MNTVREVKIFRVDVKAQRLEQRTDYLAEETPLHIFLNQIHYATILCLPTLLKELAIGNLLSEGVIQTTKEIQEIRLEQGGKCEVRLKSSVDVERRISISRPFARLVVSACGSPDYWPLSKLVDRLELTKLPMSWQLRAEAILESVRQLNNLAETFRKTGGVHVAALYSADSELLTYAEDVGRHNAVDKIIGAAALKNTELSMCFIATSGRLTGDIVVKAARMRIPILASMTAAISSGLEAAQRTGITLVSFARGNRLNILTYPERIIR